MYSHVLHGKQLALGYTVAIPGFFQKKVPAFASFPNQQTVDILRRWHVRYLLYTTHDLPVFRSQIAPVINQLQGLITVGDFGGYPGERVYVYEISVD